VAGVLDALGVERAIVVGNSLGVMVALAFYRMFAERVLALGLLCGRTVADDVQGARARNELAASVERDGTAALLDRYGEQLFSPAFLEERPDVVARAATMIERYDPRGAAAVLRGMALRLDSGDLLGEIDVPVRVIAGSGDRFVPVSEMREIAAAIGGAPLDVLACGHVPALEAPRELAALLMQLVDVVRSRANA
ncbi:MAG TPA: alpha/beta fold hydrolase, partial [Candidatus Acidoferrales bacterium]|nr:alpha/beta fold hydrolase [Candidatus Acidoferrales bacterium]